MRLTAERNDGSTDMASFQTLSPSERRLASWLGDAPPARADFPCTKKAWVELADNAAEAGVAALVLDHASANGVELPAIFRERLRAASMTVAVRHLNMMRELENVVRAFNQAGVPVMLLKGAALNLTVYERADQRPMSDLDLLVKPEDADKTLALLRSHGCRSGYDLIRDDFFPKYHYEIELFTGHARPTRLDLHVRPFRPLRLAAIMPDAALWHGATLVRTGKSEAYIPRPELMFLQLAAHAGFHGCSRLLWLYDLKRLAGHCGVSLDWALVSGYAAQWRLSCAAAYAMGRTEALLGQVFPASARGELRAHPTNWQDRWTLRQAPRDAASPLAHVACNFLCTPGWRLRAGYLMAHLLPGRNHLGERYPHRHFGWTGVAHLLRTSRAIGKVSTLPVRMFAAAAKAVFRRCVRVATSPDSPASRRASVHDTKQYSLLGEAQ